MKRRRLREFFEKRNELLLRERGLADVGMGFSDFHLFFRFFDWFFRFLPVFPIF